MSDLQIVPGRFKIAMIDQESGRIVLTVIYDRPSMDVVVYGEEKAVYIGMYKEASNAPTYQDFYIVLKEMTRSAMTLAFDIFHEKDYYRICLPQRPSVYFIVSFKQTILK